MNKHKLLALICLYLLTLTACCDDDFQPPTDSSSMNLDNLVVGMQFKYTLLIGEQYWDSNQDIFEYTGDTLILDVLEATDGEYLISEQISPHSNMMTDSTYYDWPGPHAIFTNTWKVENETLTITSPNPWNQSHLLKRFEFPINNITETELQVRGWKTSHDYCECHLLGFTSGFTLLDQDFGRCNIFIDNSAMQLDGPGNTTIYSRTEGIVRTTSYSWWTSMGFGWDRILE